MGHSSHYLAEFQVPIEGSKDLSQHSVGTSAAHGTVCGRGSHPAVLPNENQNGLWPPEEAIIKALGEGRGHFTASQ